MRDAGADRIGVAIDAASPDIFDQLRGRGVRGPHRWDRYWRVLDWSLEVFGTGMAGAHLICGLGETEKQLVHAMDRVSASGGFTHLFSFFPERGSAMEHVQPPPMAVYRRIQLARWLIDNDHVRARDFTFDEQDRVHDFGIGPDELLSHIWTGKPFETSGCPGPDGSVACNRPYGNEKPGPDIRNFPFPPERQDIETILAQMDG
jgi:biotin synthase